MPPLSPNTDENREVVKLLQDIAGQVQTSIAELGAKVDNATTEIKSLRATIDGANGNPGLKTSFALIEDRVSRLEEADHTPTDCPGITTLREEVNRKLAESHKGWDKFLDKIAYPLLLMALGGLLVFTVNLYLSHLP